MTVTRGRCRRIEPGVYKQRALTDDGVTFTYTFERIGRAWYVTQFRSGRVVNTGTASSLEGAQLVAHGWPT